jgi:hypothetical protein
MTETYKGHEAAVAVQVQEENLVCWLCLEALRAETGLPLEARWRLKLRDDLGVVSGDTD